MVHTHTPYVGEFQGATYNSQALFARRAKRHELKLKHAFKERHELLKDHDFVALQETQGTEGAARSLRLPRGVRAFGTHGTVTQAGIGLLVKE